MKKYRLYNIKQIIINFLDSKLLLVLLSFVFACIASLSLVYSLIASEQKELRISSSEGEFYINSLIIGETNYPLKQFANENIKYDGEKLIVSKDYEFKKNYSKVLNLKINISSKEKNEINVKNGTEEKKILVDKNVSSYSSIERLSINLINYFRTITISRLIILLIFLILSFFLFYIAFNFIKKFFKKINNEDINIIEILKFQLSIIYLYTFSLYMLIKILNIYILIPFILLMILPIYKMRKNISTKIAEVFVVLITISGLFMSFVLPPFQVPDEASHFFKAYSIFYQEDVVVNDSYRTSKAMINFPKKVGQIIDKYNMDVFSSEYIITAKEYFGDASIKVNDTDDKQSFFFGNTYDLPNFCYLPAAIIIFICVKLNLPFIFILLFARIINLIIFSLVGFYALKILPKFKKIFLIVMLLPITIQQAVGINQDSLTNTIFILISAILINIFFNKEKVSNKKIIILMLLSTFLGLCKTGYFAILFLILFIPKKKFENEKLSIIYKLLIILPCLFLSFRKYFEVATVTSNANVSYYTIAELISNPMQIFFVCLNTMIHRLHFDLLTGLIDGFGWSTVWNKPLIQFIITIVTVLLILTSSDKKEKLNIKARIIMLGISLIMFGMIYASLLFGWTNYGATEIDGLQCRYFIPVVLILYIGISNQFIELKFKNNTFIQVLGIILIITLCFYTIISSFYV